ncbi:hypothetical protein [Kaarinaea lacus]
MNHEFLYIFGMVMLCRLPFFGDQPLSKLRWLLMSSLQLLFCLMLNITWSWLILILTLFIVNYVVFYWENARQEVIYGLRFTTLIIFCVTFSVLFSAPFNPGFNQSVIDSMKPINDYVLILEALNNAGWLNINAIIMGALLVTTEINFFIRYIFSAFNLIPHVAVTESEQPGIAVVDSKEYNAGRFIGILERILIFFFVLVSQYTAIAFIIAAKGFTRFKDLDQREFAEYVLIGTLLSASSAVLAALLVKTIIN